MGFAPTLGMGVEVEGGRTDDQVVAVAAVGPHVALAAEDLVVALAAEEVVLGKPVLFVFGVDRLKKFGGEFRATDDVVGFGERNRLCVPKALGIQAHGADDQVVAVAAEEVVVADAAEEPVVALAAEEVVVGEPGLGVRGLGQEGGFRPGRAPLG